MSQPRVLWLTALAMLAFAGNSLLCRLALSTTRIDPASFTAVRLVTGALALWLIVAWRRRDVARQSAAGDWPSALALLVYAAGFSFAYVNIDTGIGALVLFGSVQVVMIGVGIWRGERQTGQQTAGMLLALAGLLGLLLPGAAAPPVLPVLLMGVAGAGWAVYSLRGRGEGDPLHVTAGNFRRAAWPGVALCAVFANSLMLDSTGFAYAVVSGALTSGVGYAIWYAALPSLQATHAATVQLSVPVLAALAGVLLLNEPLTLRLVLTGLLILGGIAIVYLSTPRQ